MQSITYFVIIRWYKICYDENIKYFSDKQKYKPATSTSNLLICVCVCAHWKCWHLLLQLSLLVLHLVCDWLLSHRFSNPSQWLRSKRAQSDCPRAQTGPEWWRCCRNLSLCLLWRGEAQANSGDHWGVFGEQWGVWASGFECVARLGRMDHSFWRNNVSSFSWYIWALCY